VKISAVFHDVTRVESDCLVAPLWRGERPPRGLAGRADWHLCGFISRLILAGRLSGEIGETTLVAAQGKLVAPRLLLLGLGPRGAVDATAASGHLQRAAAVVGGLRLSSVALELPPVDSRPAMRALLGELGETFAGALPPGEGEIQILAATEDECERWRAAIRDAFPRGQVRSATARLPRR
jgi:hypothetical protein